MGLRPFLFCSSPLHAVEAVKSISVKMAEREVLTKNTDIPDGACEQYGCRAAWGVGNHLFVYAGKCPPSTDQSSGPAPPCAKVHQVNWDAEMHKPSFRKLLNETHGIFLKLQNLDPNEKSHTRKNSLVKISREYRSVIKACELEIKAALSSCYDDAKAEDMRNELGLLSVIELVWNLAEILFVETLPGGVVLQQLLEWLRMHFTDGDQYARDALRDENPHNHPHYWNAVYSYLLQGRMEEVRKLLSVHPQCQTEPYVIMDQLLKRMPIFGSFTGQSVSEFELRWRHWQDECLQRMEQGDFATDDNLLTVAKVLCGEDEVFLELRPLAGEWYCLLLSRLLFQQPAVKAFDLHYHAEFCIDAYGGHSRLQPYDTIILAALEFDIHQVIRESSSSLNNWWFSAHLTDLLYHCGKLETQSLQYGSSLREFLLLEYASSLFSHNSLWQTGADYLDHCPESGQAYLEHYVERIPLDTERKAQKVIRLCEQRDMQDQIRSICKVMGMKALHNGRLGSALSWGLRSKDVNFATFLAEKFLNEYSDTGDFSHLDLLDNLGPSMLLSSKLTFVGKYREFHRLYKDGEFKAAAELLLSLLTAKIAPRKFWFTLLTDALPILESEEVVFDKNQTFELMHCLEEVMVMQKLQKKPQPDTAAEIERQDLEKEKLDLMKLGLARNLARAIIVEGTLS